MGGSVASGLAAKAIASGGGLARHQSRYSEPVGAIKPFLREVRVEARLLPAGQFPATVPVFSRALRLSFPSAVTMFVGENGSGKSTLLETIAFHCGFDLEGGNRNHRVRQLSVTEELLQEPPPLATATKLSWSPKITQGFFLRAESFFNFASYIDRLAEDDPRAFARYGGRSLHAQSHGESFLSLFENMFENGIYLLDEPEAALSPQRQLAFLTILHDLASSGRAQFIIATHSPIILAYPGARIYSFDGGQIAPIAYQDTEHYRVTKGFLDAPERYFRHLFNLDQS
jgi:predicted ATPase